MQKNQFSFKKSSWLLSIIVAAFSLVIISSCTGNDEKANLSPTCMTLTKKQIAGNWAPIFTNPNNKPNIRIAVLKFYSSYNRVSGGYDVSVQAFNNADSALGNLIDLSPGVACGVNLPPLVTGRSNDINISSLNIFNADGTLVDNFVKIILTPGVYTDGGFDFLKFDTNIVIGDTSPAGPTALPCPPCQNCKPIPVGCGEPKDTTKDNMSHIIDTNNGK